MKHPARATVLVTLALVAGGLLAVVRVGGAVADTLGLVTVSVALVLFCRAVFRLGDDESAAARGRSPARRLR